MTKTNYFHWSWDKRKGEMNSNETSYTRNTKKWKQAERWIGLADKLSTSKSYKGKLCTTKYRSSSFSPTLARVSVENNLFHNQRHMTSFLQEIWRIPYSITYAFQITIVFTFLPLNLILYTNFTKRILSFIVWYFPYHFSWRNRENNALSKSD